LLFLFFSGAGQRSSKCRTLPTRAAEKQKEDWGFGWRETFHKPPKLPLIFNDLQNNGLWSQCEP